MRNTVIILILASCFVLGCDQDGVFDASSGISDSGLERASSLHGVIMLDGFVADPSGFNEICSVSGEILYTYSLPGGENTGCSNVSFTLSASGEVLTSSPDKTSWPFENESTESVCAGPSGVWVEKIYSLQGRGDGAALHVRLLLGQNGVAFGQMWLALPSSEPARD